MSVWDILNQLISSYIQTYQAKFYIIYKFNTATQMDTKTQRIASKRGKFPRGVPIQEKFVSN